MAHRQAPTPKQGRQRQAVLVALLRATATRRQRWEGDRRKLHALTKARPTDERMYAMRLVSVSVLVVIGGGTWLELVWPTLLPESVRVSIPELWRAACIVVLIAVALEWTWYRRRMRRLTEYQGMQRGDPSGEQ